MGDGGGSANGGRDRVLARRKEDRLKAVAEFEFLDASVTCRFHFRIRLRCAAVVDPLVTPSVVHIITSLSLMSMIKYFSEFESMYTT